MRQSRIIVYTAFIYGPWQYTAIQNANKQTNKKKSANKQTTEKKPQTNCKLNPIKQTRIFHQNIFNWISLIICTINDINNFKHECNIQHQHHFICIINLIISQRFNYPVLNVIQVCANVQIMNTIKILIELDILLVVFVLNTIYI